MPEFIFYLFFGTIVASFIFIVLGVCLDERRRNKKSVEKS